MPASASAAGEAALPRRVINITPCISTPPKLYRRCGPPLGDAAAVLGAQADAPGSLNLRRYGRFGLHRPRHRNIAGHRGCAWIRWRSSTRNGARVTRSSGLEILGALHRTITMKAWFARFAYSGWRAFRGSSRRQRRTVEGYMAAWTGRASPQNGGQMASALPLFEGTPLPSAGGQKPRSPSAFGKILHASLLAGSACRLLGRRRRTYRCRRTCPGERCIWRWDAMHLIATPSPF